jgi:hypothetical protein
MIPQVIFKFDRKKDLWNIWDTANSASSYGTSWKNAVTKNIHQICDGKKYEKCEEELKQTMNYLYNNPLTKRTAELFSNAWKGIEQEYFNRLERMMKSPFCVNKINAYLTTAGRCPYEFNRNHPSFFVGFFWGIPAILETAGHELMHIQFHNSKYWNICKKEIGEKKTWELKEALTALLDLEFKDLWIMDDGGYLNHKKLREYITKEWKMKKDFDILIDKSIKWIKNNGIK